MSRASPAFRRARRCYGHLAGEAGVYVRHLLEESGVLRQSGAVYRLTDQGRVWARSLGFDDDDRQPARYARCCLDGSEKQWHVGGRLGAAILGRLLATHVLRQGEGRILDGAGEVALRAALVLPEKG